MTPGLVTIVHCSGGLTICSCELWLPVGGGNWKEVTVVDLRTGPGCTKTAHPPPLTLECRLCPLSPSVKFSHSVMSNSLWPQELQQARPPCPSPTPGVYQINSSLLSRWCHPTISSSVIRFSSCSQSFPASGSFPMSQFFTSGGQSIGVQFQHQSFQWTPRIDLL